MTFYGIIRMALFFFVLALPARFYGEERGPDPLSSANEIALQRLEMEIGRAANLAEGTVGVSALHFESGQRISFNAGKRFPMASTYKIPIAVQILTKVDRQELNLERLIEVKQRDLRPGSGILAVYLTKPGVLLSVQNLLELMLLASDNSATDLLLELAGGPEAVTARMRALQINEMDVHRSTAQLLADSAGYSLPSSEEWSLKTFQRLYDGTTRESRKEAARKFVADPRDTTTPQAMMRLLEVIYEGKVLADNSKAVLLDMMERCQTGKGRIRGFLLPDTPVAHKTGTIAGTGSDAGLITLPGNAGHVAIAAYVIALEKESSDRERTIAHISRSLYDFFLFRRP